MPNAWGRALALAALVASVAACENKSECGGTASCPRTCDEVTDCPVGYACSSRVCVRDERDAGPTDASVDDATAD